MDPVTAIGLVGNIFAFVEIGLDILKGAKDVYASAGCLEENRQRGVIARETERLASKLLVSNNARLTGADKGLFDLATECQKISRDLISLLDKMKAKDPKSKFHSVKSSVRNKWYQKDKQDLEQRLQICRSQLELQLSYLASQDIRERLASLVDSSEEEIARLKKLEDYVTGMQGLSVYSFGAAAQAQLSALLRVPQDVLTKIAQERVLASLELDGVRGRYEMVPEAHSKTFRWLFDDHDNLSLDADRHLARERLNSWLSSGDGIFHISGKLGSGKSTLMKFLCPHPKMMAQLQQWAGDRTLVFAHFFFWKPGTPLQKSLAGLCRALLHDVLQACPELIQYVLYKAWTKAAATPWQMQSAGETSDSEILEGFNRLTELGPVNEQHCFCFFIDGLDEFEETTQYDHRDLVKQMCKWSEVSSGYVKLCVSSREHSIFMNTFASERRLRLHQLTWQDMRAFSEDRLSHIANVEARQRLVGAVVDKAQGIFLWVALVIRSIRRQWEDGADIAELEDELHSLPDELSGLYEYILNSLCKTVRRKFYHTCAILRLAKTYDIPLSLLRYSLLEDYERNPEFAMAEDYPQEDIKYITQEERQEHGVRRLNGFKGLLETDARNRVDFCHQSVDEFLQDPNKETCVAQYLRSFNAPDAFSQILLADLRLGEAPINWGLKLERGSERGLERGYSLSTGLLRMRAEHELDQAPYSFLSLLHDIYGPLPWHLIDSGYPCEMYIRTALKVHDRICCTTPSYLCEEPYKTTIYVPLLAPIYVLTYLGYHEYPVWKILHDQDATATPAKAIILAYCDLRCDSNDESSTRVKGMSVLEALLARGALSPNDTGPYIRYFYFKPLDRDGNRALEQLSLWHSFLASIYLQHHIRRGAEGPSRDVCLWRRVLKLLLQCKPKLYFSMTLYSEKTDFHGTYFARMKLSRFVEPFKVRLLLSASDRCFAYSSLRSFLEQSQFKDKEALLQMYDSQVEEERAAGNIITS
ncbi:hypothetical protein DTO169E5_2939 [Paecilomyces variotii]|nr:hypothetical protein DTO169E5_2939 [Paecilomyces variotii]KAJ9391443.1 hypothetical protein DTO063F5_1053 [Paecilomyces variotii]